MFQACIFDLDGTLLDTLADIAASVNHTLVAHGFPSHPLDAYRRFVGDGVETCMRRVLPPEAREDARIQRMVAEMRATYVARAEQDTRPYDGIPELLAGLQADGMPMAVLSNKPHPMLRAAVARFFPEVPFVEALGVAADTPPKPDLTGARRLNALLGVPAESVCYVGDTDTDMQTAVAAGYYGVGVAWGFRAVAELQAAGARRIVHHPRDLAALIKEARS